MSNLQCQCYTEETNVKSVCPTSLNRSQSLFQRHKGSHELVSSVILHFTRQCHILKHQSMPCSYAWIIQLARQQRDTVYTRSKKDVHCILSKGRKWETLLQMWAKLSIFIVPCMTPWWCEQEMQGQCEARHYTNPFWPLFFLPLGLSVPQNSNPLCLSSLELWVMDPSGTAYPSIPEQLFGSSASVVLKT